MSSWRNKVANQYLRIQVTMRKPSTMHDLKSLQDLLNNLLAIRLRKHPCIPQIALETTVLQELHCDVYEISRSKPPVEGDEVVAELCFLTGKHKSTVYRYGMWRKGECCRQGTSALTDNVWAALAYKLETGHRAYPLVSQYS